MSDTPRTDEMEKLISPTIYMVKADFARQLERELNELNEWKAGMKGIEDYYIVKEKLYVAETAADSWRKCANRLAASLRSKMRGEDARYSETGRPCAQSDLEEFNRLASKP